MSNTGSRSKTVDRVVGAELCSGCGLCAGVSDGAIRMEPASPGYARPVQRAPVSRESEVAIAGACPGAVVAAWPDDEDVHPYWGPLRSVSVGAAAADAVRHEGSSGGAISALLIHALETRIIDRVVHVAADPAYPTRNVTAVSRTAAEILERAGSRYTSSSPLAAIDAELAQGGAFAFVGKPCDASALRELGKVDPRVAQRVPLILSFFCGGIPSYAGADRILSALGMAGEKILDFRYRGRGWPGNCVAVGESRVAEMSYADSWGGHLSKEVQFRCKICPDAVGGVADVACADAWYGDDAGYPSFDEQEGRSLIIGRSVAGEALLASAIANGSITASPLDPSEIEKMQPSQARRKRLVLARMAALVVALQGRPRMTGLRVLEAAGRGGLLDALRNFLGMLRRIYRGTRSRL